MTTVEPQETSMPDAVARQDEAIGTGHTSIGQTGGMSPLSKALSLIALLAVLTGAGYGIKSALTQGKGPVSAPASVEGLALRHDVDASAKVVAEGVAADTGLKEASVSLYGPDLPSMGKGQTKWELILGRPISNTAARFLADGGSMQPVQTSLHGAMQCSAPDVSWPAECFWSDGKTLISLWQFSDEQDANPPTAADIEKMASIIERVYHGAER